jgi:hypothetical protein
MHRAVVYAYDGLRWQRFPEDAATYSRFAILEPEGSNTMFRQDLTGGGRTGTTAFSW